MKDSISSRRDLIATPLAGIGLLALVVMKKAVLATLRAINSLRVALVSDVIQTNVIIREGVLKIFQGELHHWAFGHLGYLL